MIKAYYTKHTSIEVAVANQTIDTSSLSGLDDAKELLTALQLFRRQNKEFSHLGIELVTL